ncbi:hypothetical protein [Streptomyces tendae]
MLYQAQSDLCLAMRAKGVDLSLGSNPSVGYAVADAGETKVVGACSGAGHDRQGWIAGT